MPDPSLEDLDLANALLSEYQQKASTPASCSMPAAVLMDSLIAQRMIMDERVRRAAYMSWLVVVVCVLISGLLWYMSRRDVEIIAEFGEAMVGTFNRLIVLSLALSIVLTISWLFRTRGLAPSAIDRRLAAIEARLTRSA